MNDVRYRKIAHTYWTGPTGRLIRDSGHDAQLFGVYLLSNEHSNWIGLYRLPLRFVEHELGFSEPESKDLIGAMSAADFAYYDPATEYIWVRGMASWQISKKLEKGDNRIRGIEKTIQGMPDNPWINPFLKAYAKPFNLNAKGLRRVSKAPSEALPRPFRGPSEPGTGAVPGTEAVNRKNKVIADGGMTFQPGKDGEEDEKASGVIERIVAVTESPQSEPFYRMAIKTLGDGIVMECLGELKYRINALGNIREPGAYFTTLLQERLEAAKL